MSEQTEIEAAVDRALEQVPEHGIEWVTVSPVEFAQLVVAALDSLREYQMTPDALHEAQMEAEHYREQLAREREARERYRAAALELNAAIRHGLAWIATEAEPSVAHAQMLRTADAWRHLLEDADDG